MLYRTILENKWTNTVSIQLLGNGFNGPTPPPLSLRVIVYNTSVLSVKQQLQGVYGWEKKKKKRGIEKKTARSGQP